MSSSCLCCRLVISMESISNLISFSPGTFPIFSTKSTTSTSFRTRASIANSFDNSANFADRVERAWLISQQPRPVSCSSCDSNGGVECKWCNGTGFFILGDNMLCEVPSRNTTCVICAGKGSTRCCDCKGTGFRAKWLGDPQNHP